MSGVGGASVWGQGFRPAAELPLGAELYVRAGSADDPSSPVFLSNLNRFLG